METEDETGSAGNIGEHLIVMYLALTLYRIVHRSGSEAAEKVVNLVHESNLNLERFIIMKKFHWAYQDISKDIIAEWLRNSSGGNKVLAQGTGTV